MHQVVATVLLMVLLLGVLSEATPAQTELRPSSTCIRPDAAERRRRRRQRHELCDGGA